jgi:hypothetical protein
MFFFSEQVLERMKGLVAACEEAVTEEMQRPFSSAHEAWAVIKELREQAKKQEKDADKLHGEIWEAVVEKNEDQERIELRELGKVAAGAALVWASIAAAARRGAGMPRRDVPPRLGGL